MKGRPAGEHGLRKVRLAGRAVCLKELSAPLPTVADASRRDELEFGMEHPLWPSVAAGIVASQSGAPEAGQQLANVWARLGEGDHAMRCIVAHYYADLQNDVLAELKWDQRALAAHHHLRDDELAPLGLPSAAALLPSLHLNLGDTWLRAGDPEQARRHLDQARAADEQLGQDPYGDLARRGVDGLAARIEAALSTD